MKECDFYSNCMSINDTVSEESAEGTPIFVVGDF